VKTGPDYAKRIDQQLKQYANVDLLHRLPAIRDYWFAKFIRPRVQQVFYAEKSRRGDFYANLFEDILRHTTSGDARLLSLGAGDGKHEITIVKQLQSRGLDGFKLECLELSETLLEMAKQTAEENGVSELMLFSQADLNEWSPGREYAGVLAHQALHHFVNLERIFSNVIQCIGTTGIFATCDVIGRNGHLLWPEMLSLTESLWSSLPIEKKFNHQLKKTYEAFPNHDCSAQGFEGIRAQDILPLLVKNFRFEYFLGYGGLTDPFIGRGFGANYSPESNEDRTFIDAIQLMNDTLCDVGYLKPTRMMAVLRHPSSRGERRFFRHWTPEFCVRIPDASGLSDEAC
jgi:2-polyprenyl-3-methyl-5-hydroxy-6-metoxy-1,4-benzoquinol methylase